MVEDYQVIHNRLTDLQEPYIHQEPLSYHKNVYHMFQLARLDSDRLHLPK